MSENGGGKFVRFWRALSESAVLLQQFPSNTRTCSTSVEPLPSLLEQCGQLCEEARLEQREPIRTIHHFACTGGTLLSKCIASMPNTHLLSEVDPLREYRSDDARRFAPTDLIYRLGDTRLLEQSELVVDVFLRGLSAIYEHCCSIGARLVVRDHSHSHYCSAVDYASRKTLRSILSQNYETLSIVTVRHPLDSYLSLRSNKWIHFLPGTLEEYSSRYLSFLSDYAECPRVRYEDFVDEPRKVMSGICRLLRLPYSPDFTELFGVIKLSGDSGRKADEIGPRDRREVPPEVAEEAAQSPVYKQLCEELGYLTRQKDVDIVPGS